MTFYYLLACTFTVVLFTWMVVKFLQQTKYPPNNNDDNGGSSDDNNFPIIDLPPGSSLDDWLTDRTPDDVPALPTRPSGLPV